MGPQQGMGYRTKVHVDTGRYHRTVYRNLPVFTSGKFSNILVMEKRKCRRVSTVCPLLPMKAGAGLPSARTNSGNTHKKVQDDLVGKRAEEQTPNIYLGILICLNPRNVLLIQDIRHILH